MVARDFTPVGEVHGRLTIIGDAPSTGTRRRVLARCSCGTVKDFQLNNLRTGTTKSCGCILRENPANVSHGHARVGAKNKTYHSWLAMKQRCTYPKAPQWADYGGRGIKVCDRWLNSFEDFLADMGERPDGSTLDRYPDVNGNYEPGNCRWSSHLDQMNNTRRNRFIEFDGKRMTVSQWERHLGMPYRLLSIRLNRGGWSVERALTEPPRKTKSRSR